MNRRRRYMNVIICCMFIFVTFASLFYIIKEADHDCVGDDCPVCACIHQAEQTLKNVSAGVVSIFAISVIILTDRIQRYAYRTDFYADSLVSLKVRMDD